ncbi:MAG TPA: hypothetical protein VGN34_00400 [Ktedonobacteraceae bacterium]|jgi:hypothetical protein
MSHEIKVKLLLKRETQGALLYNEVDKGDIPTPQAFARIGSFYLRKRNFPNGVFPKYITVTVTCDE